MKYANKILTAGIIVILIPFLGLPSSWKTFLFILAGLSLCVLSVSMRTAGTHVKKHSHTRKTVSLGTPFTDSKQGGAAFSGDSERSESHEHHEQV